MDILHYVIDNNPITIRQVADHFAKKQGLARTTDRITSSSGCWDWAWQFGG